MAIDNEFTNHASWKCKPVNSINDIAGWSAKNFDDSQWGGAAVSSESVLNLTPHILNIQSWFNCIDLQTCFVKISRHISEQIQLILTSEISKLFIIKLATKSCLKVPLQTQKRSNKLHIVWWQFCKRNVKSYKESHHKKASNHHANLPLEMYSFTL